MRVIALSINADQGATASRGAVVTNLRSARRRDITLGHINQPDGRTPKVWP